MKWRYYYYRLLALGLALVVADIPARAEEEVLGSIQLRSGYDSNPVFVPGSEGTALGGVNAAIVAGRTTESYVAAMSGEAGYTRYGERTDPPLERYRAAFDIANHDGGGYSLKSATSVTAFSNYDTKSLDAVERVQLRKTDSAVQPFVTVEARYSELNESNLLLGDFLPRPEKFLRGTIIPGVAAKKDAVEIGASVNLSATRYEDRYDIFGFRRDNERVQPFLFVKYNKDKFSLFAAVSRLYGDWHDPDFFDVRKNLYQVELTYETGPFGFEFSARRSAEETTFPISPVTINTLVGGKAAKKLDAKNAVALFARYFEKEYLDSPFKQRTKTYGAQFTHDLSDRVSIGFELARSDMRPIAGPNVDGVVAVASLTQRFGDKKRAEETSSAR
jgi:hypothetical protein